MSKVPLVPLYPVTIFGFEVYASRLPTGDVYPADCKAGTMMPREAFEELKAFVAQCETLYDHMSDDDIAAYNRARYSVPFDEIWPVTYPTYVSHPKTDGYVYLMYSTDGTYKIGLSVNPQRRAEDLSEELNKTITVIHIIRTDNMKQLETRLHKRFADKRLNGEWFALTDEDVQAIKQMHDQA